MPAERGFTLVEIMLAVALLSIIVTVMYSAFHTVGRIMRRTEETKGAYQAARLIMSRMREDLGCAYFSPTRKNFVFKGEDIEGRDGGMDALTFVTTGHVVSGKDVAEGDLAEVSYYLDEDNPGVLVRREDVSPDDKPEVGGVLDILGKNVVALNFTYLDGTEEPARRTGRTTTDEDMAQKEREAWKEEWDSEEKAYLPRAVRIDLSLLNEEGKVEDFSTTVLLAMGRTATSSEPAPRVAGQVFVPATPARPRQAVPQGGGRRTGRPGERGRRGDLVPPRGRRGERRGREGMGRPPASGAGPGRRSGPRIQRNAPNAPPRMLPPMRGGRR